MIDIYTQNDVELFDYLSKEQTILIPVLRPRYSLRLHGFYNVHKSTIHNK